MRISFQKYFLHISNNQGEINVALKGIDLDSLTLEQIIKQALKKMMKG